MMEKRVVMPEETWRMYLRLRYCLATLEARGDVKTEEENYPFSAADMLRPDGLERLMQVQAAQLGQTVNPIIGMMFAKRYSVLIMGLLSAMSLFDRMLDASPNRVRLRVTKFGQMEYMLEETADSPPVLDEGMRRHIADRQMKNLLQDHVGPVYAAVSQRTGASLGAMWSLLSANIQNMYLRMETDKWVPVSGNRAIVLKADCVRLLDRDWQVVAGFKRNPLAVRLREFRHPAYEGTPILLRKACCMAYMLLEDGEDHGYCSTCPKPGPDERLQALLREHR